MGCFTCGKSAPKGINKKLAYFKEMYVKHGTVRYFYKLSSSSDVLICRGSEFSVIFTKQIKPNLINGAEYAHISEYNPKP